MKAPRQNFTASYEPMIQPLLSLGSGISKLDPLLTRKFFTAKTWKLLFWGCLKFQENLSKTPLSMLHFNHGKPMDSWSLRTSLGKRSQDSSMGKVARTNLKPMFFAHVFPSKKSKISKLILPPLSPEAFFDFPLFSKDLRLIVKKVEATCCNLRPTPPGFLAPPMRCRPLWGTASDRRTRRTKKNGKRVAYGVYYIPPGWWNIF